MIAISEFVPTFGVDELLDIKKYVPTYHATEEDCIEPAAFHPSHFAVSPTLIPRAAETPESLG